MSTFKTLIDVVFVAFGVALLTGCPDNKSSEDIGPASGGTSAGGETGPDASPPDEPVRPEAMPMLCTIDDGKWCSPCPSGDAGPLCCVGETCAPWAADSGLTCAGVFGWCTNYTTSQHVATCHDAN